eukprot:gene11121-23243_t
MGGGTSKTQDDKPPQQMSEADRNHPDNKKLSADEWTDIKDKRRHCTDCICLLLLILVWFIMTVIGFVVTGVVKDSNLSPGNPARLTNAVDYDGRTCGVSSSVKSKPSGYYMPTGAVVCVSSCPSETNYYQFICQDEYQADADADIVVAWTYVSKKVCLYHAKTYKVLNRCIYNGDDGNGNTTAASVALKYGVNSVVSKYSSSLTTSSSDGPSWLTNFISDLWALKGYIFGFGLGISTVFAFLYLFFLRIPGLLQIIIWGIIISVQICLLICSILLYQLAVTWKKDGVKSKYEVQFMYVVAVIGFVITGLYFCLMLVLRKRIALAISIVKEACKAVSAMPILILMPIVEVLGCVMFLIPWCIYVVYLASSGDVTVVQEGDFHYKTISYNKNTKYAFVYMLFCWFWTSQFLIAVGQLIIALAVTKWYFTADKRSTGNGDVFWAARTTMRYHLGTAAHGSLIIAIIKTIRAVVSYFQKKAKDSHNRIAQFFLCCIQCCLWCIEKCMKFINKHAYIQTAIHGYGFCKAARAAFFLILRNILRVAAVNMVSEFVLLLGKLFVPVLTTFICYLCIGYGLPASATSGIVGPLILCAILSYFVACMFSEIFGMAIETILCCYIADEELFPPEKRFADGGLKSAVQKHAQEKAQVEPAGGKGGGGAMM